MSVQSLIWTVALAVALLSVASTRHRSEQDLTDGRLDVNELRSEMESSVLQHREEPFDQRPFKPYQGDTWIGNAVAYGCYRAGQAPGKKGPSDAEILEDLEIIATQWSLIRLYGADDDTKRVLRVIKSHKLPLKVALGIWLEPEASPEQKRANVEQVVACIELANLFPDIVMAVNVGNETQVFWSGHRMNPERLIHYIRAVRSKVTIPVTTADDYNFWNKPESKQVSDEIDFVMCHIHPLWNGKTLENAIDWLGRTHAQIQAMHPHKTVVIGETGWATNYNPNKNGAGEQGTLIKGEVSAAAQARFVRELNEWVTATLVSTFLFEAFDEPWKGGGELSESNDVEKHWGVFFEDRTPKGSLRSRPQGQ